MQQFLTVAVIDGVKAAFSIVLAHVQPAFQQAGHCPDVLAPHMHVQAAFMQADLLPQVLACTRMPCTVCTAHAYTMQRSCRVTFIPVRWHAQPCTGTASMQTGNS